MTGDHEPGRPVRFREQARSAYNRDFGAAIRSDRDDDLDRRSRLSPWPVVAALLAVATLLAVGLVVQVPVALVVTPVSALDGQLVAVPAEGAATVGLVGAPGEIRQAGQRTSVRVTAATRWRMGDREIPAVLLSGSGIAGIGPDEVTAVVFVGERALLTDLFSDGGPR